MNKTTMIEMLTSKIDELEASIAAGKAEDKLVGRFKRQVRPLYVIKALLEQMYDTEEVILGPCQSDFIQLIECSKGHSKYDLEEGMTLNEVMQKYPALSMTKLEKKGFKMDFAKGIIVKA